MWLVAAFEWNGGRERRNSWRAQHTSEHRVYLSATKAVVTSSFTGKSIRSADAGRDGADDDERHWRRRDDK